MPDEIRPLQSNHLLALPRPDALYGPHPDAPDTTTLAAHDFDVDPRTGFMPPEPPLARLPAEWESWESTLEVAMTQKLRLGHTTPENLHAREKEKSERWRDRVRNLPVLPVEEGLTAEEVRLRRAHHVLAWILHFYIHSLPPQASASASDHSGSDNGSSPIHIPAPLALPLLQVSAHLRLPPVLTYSDNVLYNWVLPPITPPSPTAPLSRPAFDHLRCQTTFTGTTDEEAFYLTAARIELKGVDALNAMQDIMDEMFVGDELAVDRIATYLGTLAGVIRELRTILLGVREACEPEFFYREIRPWLKGIDSFEYGGGRTTTTGTEVPETRREWVFEGMESDSSLAVPRELSGPSAGQSTMMHALDVFFGVDHYTTAGRRNVRSSTRMKPSASWKPAHSRVLLSVKEMMTTGSVVQDHDQTAGGEAGPGGSTEKEHESEPTFMERMKAYMPRHHRAFLSHLSANPRTLRGFVEERAGTSAAAAASLREAYNGAVLALKEFRDAHMQIVALYIVGPAARTKKDELKGELKGTGGTDLVKFLKGVRERTRRAVM